MNLKTLLGVNVVLFAVSLLTVSPANSSPTTSPLTDWKIWETSRKAVQHPAITVKADDIARARENIKRYPWAQAYLKAVEGGAAGILPKLTPEYLAAMIPETTPGDLLFTPCPGCRDQGKPRNDHGSWTWKLTDPEKLTCKVCNTVFPNEKYPENVVLNTTWGKPQTLTFYGGEPFPIFSLDAGRPSFSGNIRAQKVDWMSAIVRRLAEAYALTGKEEYARGARLILLRLSEVYPNWLVHSGYGDYADMDPKVAAMSATALPKDELVYPPMKPDRKLHTGYWSAGRARGVGMEGMFMRKVAEAYDLTCEAKDAAGQPLYSDAERQQIERDLLLESTLLAVGDPALNNKSVGNSSATALVGMVVGHPGLVRFGLDGFLKTVNEWFLSDGTTSESSAYANMTLSGIIDFAQAFRGYSDPPGYTDAKGKRLEKLDLYHDTEYGKVWEAVYNTLQGNLLYPPFADSYRTTGIPAQFAELMAANYPNRLQYTTLLKEIAGADLSKGHAPTALYYREPGLENKTTPPLVLPDIAFPDLRIGFMREGENGRGGLLTLSASHWGGHHHDDSLNLSYWKNGQELLSDLGYLWDHPKKKMTSRTLAHNTVLIDEQNQINRERGGEILFFKADKNIKAMSAVSKAYAQVSLYQRTSALVDHGANGSYVVDFFRVQGGAKQDFIFHGPGNDFEARGLNLTPSSAPLYDFENVRSGKSADAWSLSWKVNPDLSFTAWTPSSADEQVFIGDGWGQRDHKNTDLGATLPYIVRRGEGEAAKIFGSVFEGHAPDKAMVRSVKRLEVTGETDVLALVIETAMGRDYVISQREPKSITLTTPDGVLQTGSALTVISVQNGKMPVTFTENSKPIRFNGSANVSF